ncbi:hypothetical protein [Promicromonospora sp. NPDC090134]|uniref:hypothetical protein n=1 Tax=Promicromonospora sp. NPDC090134 TaxID=3364408 RepID=UPI0037F5BC88
MLHAEDVIQVDVVTDIWTDALLPLVAIVISVGTLVWTMLDRRRDRARIKIETSIAYVVGDPQQSGPLVSIECTNVGHSGSTILKAIYFLDRRHGGKLWILEQHGGMGLTGPNRHSEMPVRLQPGEGAYLRTSPDRLAAACLANGIRTEDLRVVAETAHADFVSRLHAGISAEIRRALDSLPPVSPG